MTYHHYVWLISVPAVRFPGCVQPERRSTTRHTS